MICAFLTLASFGVGPKVRRKRWFSGKSRFMACSRYRKRDLHDGLATEAPAINGTFSWAIKWRINLERASRLMSIINSESFHFRLLARMNETACLLSAVQCYVSAHAYRHSGILFALGCEQLFASKQSSSSGNKTRRTANESRGKFAFDVNNSLIDGAHW